MSYNTNLYLLLFLPLVALAYQLTPKKHRWKTLLAASIFFFADFSSYLILWTLLTAAITWCGGLLIQSMQDKNAALPRELRMKPKDLAHRTVRVLRPALIGVIGILAVLKYTNFTMQTMANLMNQMGAHDTYQPLKILVPIGISFYSLQAAGYLLDIHWRRFRAETNFGKLFLFLIFFPTLMEGPIMRWEDMKDQLFEGESITVLSLSQGLIRIGWGLFKRMIISDRMNTMVTVLFQPQNHFSGLMILLTGVVVTVQLYMEFSGTIDIVIGSARIFQIRLTENFRQPFLSQSAAEFWRRWHITLGVWFKNYIFYPVSTSELMKKWAKFGRKHCGKYITNLVISAIALFPVWMLNGLWHGPKAPYILYGVYYFIILLIGVAIEPFEKGVCRRAGWDYNAAAFRIFRRVRTFFIVITGETLFRCETWSQFTGMLSRLFTGGDGGLFEGKILEIGADAGDLIIIAIGCAIVFTINYHLEKDPDLLEKLPMKPAPQRWAIYYAFLFSILIFGAYGTGYQAVDLIYAGF